MSAVAFTDEDHRMIEAIHAAIFGTPVVAKADHVVREPASASVPSAGVSGP